MTVTIDMDPVDVDRLPSHCGPIERQARIDVASMGPLTGGARATYAELAFNLASALDRAYGAESPLAEVVTGSKVLLAIMSEVAKTAHASSRSEEFSRFLTSLRPGTLVGDATDVGTSNAGGQGRGHRPDARKTTDAAPADGDGRGAGD